MTPSGYDWDALAPHWHLFEDRGFADTFVSALVRERVQAPVLFVGAGLGRYAAKLRDVIGQVIAVDGSPHMVARGVLMHQLPFVVADARRLPFADSSFASVVCASGVVEGMTDDERGALVHELDRVAKGGFYLGAFVLRDNAVPLDVHAVIDHWKAGAITNRAFHQIAKTIGNVEEAAAFLHRALPRIEPAITERLLIDYAAWHELSVRRIDHDDIRGVALWFLQ
jgi:ubiquinone/menaquinone biosynthesis C-methylase UbiE